MCKESCIDYHNICKIHLSKTYTDQSSSITLNKRSFDRRWNNPNAEENKWWHYKTKKVTWW